jgi:hypothetical protein
MFNIGDSFSPVSVPCIEAIPSALCTVYTGTVNLGILAYWHQRRWIDSPHKALIERKSSVQDQSRCYMPYSAKSRSLFVEYNVRHMQDI